MEQTASAFIAALIALAACRVTGAAVSWKLNNSVASSLQAWDGYPPDTDPPCTVPGVCVPATVVIPPNTLYYWCGWSTKQRTQYWVNTVGDGPALSVVMMRTDDLQSCALANLTNMKNCPMVPNSACENSTQCYTKVLGFSFVRPACVVIGNNDKKPVNASIQVWQYHDKSRYYGTVFSILLFILIGSASLGHMGYTCYLQIRKPNHRLDELEKMTREKCIRDQELRNRAAHAEDQNGTGTQAFRDASEGGIGGTAASRRNVSSGDEEVSVSRGIAGAATVSAAAPGAGAQSVGASGGLFGRFVAQVTSAVGGKGKHSH